MNFDQKLQIICFSRVACLIIGNGGVKVCNGI